MREKKKEKREENPTEPKKVNIEGEVYTRNKKCDKKFSKV